MSDSERDELKHWKKEFYRTLDEAERDLGTKFKQAKWVDHAKYLGIEAAAVLLILLVAFSVGAYLLGL